MGSRSAFGMILDGESRMVLQSDPFYGSVIEIDMGDL